MGKHTPEPWKVDDRFGTSIQSTREDSGFEMTLARLSPIECTPGKATCQANADRIVQCVNACAGMRNPGDAMRLMQSVRIDPNSNLDFGSVISEMEQLKAENARLRDALEAIANGVAPSNDKEAWMWISTARLEANTALKGGPHETR